MGIANPREQRENGKKTKNLPHIEKLTYLCTDFENESIFILTSSESQTVWFGDVVVKQKIRKLCQKLKNKLCLSLLKS